MAVITIGGYTRSQRQGEGEYRLHLCNEFAGRYLTESVNPVIPPAYKKASPAKIEAYKRCVKIAKDIPCSSEVVVMSTNCFRFVCGFYTIDSENGNINRVFWFTENHRYYADIQ